jgi:hypothetical protein
MNSENNKVKMEKCYFCGQNFDINKNDGSHYHYNKYPMCASCSEAYGFFKNNKI